MTSPIYNRDAIRELLSALGPTLVAALSGAKDRTLLLLWGEVTGPEPASDVARRLAFAHQQWALLAAASGADVARQWFISGNPLLQDVTPLTAIREDRHLDVAQAVEALIA